MRFLLNYWEWCEKILHQPVKIIRRLWNNDPHWPFYCDFEASNALIRQTLTADNPCMICRFGSGELCAIVTYLHSQDSFFRKIYHMCNEDSVTWNSGIKLGMRRNAGFFPAEDTYLDRFAELMLRDIPEADILGSWLRHELSLKSYLDHVKAVPLSSLEPYWHNNPWSEVLKGKKVLVVHPFVKSIRAQYARRELLFKDPRVLPEFELKTIPAVQSAAGNKVDFPDWFAALDDMKSKISSTDFDIAIIGAGAYGFPLAAHVKRMGKKAVHLGGASQLLFGIRGNRWEHWERYQNLFNDAWVRPLPEETPPLADQVEGATYW